MGCNKCKEPIKRCGCSKPVIQCGCPNGKVDAKCVEYRGCPLTPIGVIEGNNMEEVLELINRLFEQFEIKLEEGFIGSNSGNGARIFKGKNSKGAQEFRTIEVGEGLLISQKTDSIEISADTQWLEEYLSDFINDAKFNNRIKTLLNETWFLDLIRKFTLQPWFMEIIKYQIGKDWFVTHLSTILRQQWFEDLLQETMSEQWFIDLFKSTLNQTLVKQFMGHYIKGLINSNSIDICDIISKCNIKVVDPTPAPAPTPVPVNLPPTISGPIVYNVKNRVVNYPVTASDFTSRYSDPENDAMVSIRIVGGDVSNIVKLNGQPLRVGDVIPVGDLSGLRFSGKNVDNGYEQIIEFVAVNVLGQVSN